MRWLKLHNRSPSAQAAAPGGTEASPGVDTTPHDPAPWVFVCPARADAPVPQGFFGLRAAPGLASSWPVPAGQVLKRRAADPAAASHWWLREGPWVIEFAPQPASPEAGLRISLHPLVDAGEAGVKLVRWLAEQPQHTTLTVQDLALRWQQEPVFSTLPPCAGPQILAQRLDWIDKHLRKQMGCRADSLERIDLPPQDDGLLPVLEDPDAWPEDGATDTSIPSAPPQHEEDLTQEEPWPAVLAQDALACARLREELPELAAALRNTWSGVGAWSADFADLMRQRDTLNLLQLLASGTRQMPRLDRPASGPGAPTLAERRQIATEARRAEQALGDVWYLLKQLPVGAPPGPHQLESLALAAGRLAVATRRRQDAWWTLRADPAQAHLQPPHRPL